MCHKPITRNFNNQESKEMVMNLRQFWIMLCFYISSYFLKVLITDYFIIQGIYLNYTKLNNQIILHQLKISVKSLNYFIIYLSDYPILSQNN